MGGIKDKNGDIRYLQSGVIPFQIKKNRIKILLITSLKTKQWIFPKGIIETHLTAQESALREAEEEAGIEGEVLNIKLGEYSYLKWGGVCEVEVFPMHVTRVLDEWPEANLRLRNWVSLEKAQSLINKKELRDLIIKFEENTKKILSIIANSS
jgi:8-oxo-dGTP pyrophosphatase MutT (NUDIX family)